MTKEQFIGLLRSPSTINLNLVGELEDITTRFPYFQNAHLLLAKQYHGHENIRFESYLRKAAIYAQDRSILYRLIKTEAQEVIHIQPETEKATVVTTAGHSSSTSLHHEPVNIEDEKVVIIPAPAVSVNQSLAYEPVPEASDNTLPEEHIKIEETVKINITDPRAVIEQRLKEITRQNTDSFESKPQPSEEPNILVASNLTDSTGKDDITEKSVDEFDKPSQVVSTEKISSTYSEKSAIQKATSKTTDAKFVKHSFSEWLKLKSVEIIQPGQPVNYFDPRTLTDIPTAPNSEWRNNDLLDNFIKTEPRIIPARSEFYSPGNMARKSAIEHEDLISETLARIYAQQGNIPKAIDAYQRLSLKNPEKSGYFAALIKELEEKESD